MIKYLVGIIVYFVLGILLNAGISSFLGGAGLNSATYWIFALAGDTILFYAMLTVVENFD